MKKTESKGKVALVVGGSRGIGRAIATRLSKSGFDIWLTYKSNHDAAKSVQAEIEADGGKCELLAFDVADFKQTQKALEPKLKQTTPYIVVYNAGISADNLLVFMSESEWGSVLQTNLDGFFNITRNVLFSMISVREGRIVAVSSTSGEIGHEGQVNYSASKAGLIGACKALAREVGKRNILVNVVSPGFIDTEMTQDIPDEHVLPLIPIKRIGTPENVASVVNFLCTEEDLYIHGQVIGVNGGLAI